MHLKQDETFKPKLEVINKAQMWDIHQAALEIIKYTGFDMQHQGVKRMLLDSGCSLSSDGRIRMPEALAEAALKTVPKKIDLYDQQGNAAMDVSGENSFYGTGSDTLFTLDIETGMRRRTGIKDTANFARIVDALDNIDFAMSMSTPEDVPIGEIYVHVFAEMVYNTNKPIIFIADGLKDIERIHQIASIVAGGEDRLAQRPFILNYSEAISPLVFPENVMDKLVFCANKRIPICLPSGCNAGSGGPVTLAGAMALGLAENLIGLVIHQLTNPGAPFLFAPNVSVLDMKTTVVSYGCPEWSLTQAALAQMRDEIYGLPIWAFAGSSDSKTLDAQAGAEAMFSISTALQSRCNIIHDVGYLEFGTTSSMELLVLADELVAMSRHFNHGIPVNEETLSLKIIDEIARGNDSSSIFLTHPHTFRNFRSAHFLPNLIDRQRFENWRQDGAKDTYDRCNARAADLLLNHEVQPKPQQIMIDILEILEPQPRAMAN